MKTIGLLGGMSWESTEHYYRLINEATKAALGGLHSAPIVMVSVDFHEIEALQRAGDWEAAAKVLADKSKNIEQAGADLLLICTNTMHKVADEISAVVNIPLVHIADATAIKIKQAGITCVGLLGTRFTMEQDFYKGRLEDHGLTVLTPSTDDRDAVHNIIYEELCLGHIKDDSRVKFLDIMESLKDSGAEAIIEGCTEIGLLVKQEHTNIPLFDTTQIHAEAAVRQALS